MSNENNTLSSLYEIFDCCFEEMTSYFCVDCKDEMVTMLVGTFALKVSVKAMHREQTYLQQVDHQVARFQSQRKALSREQLVHAVLR